MIGSLWNFYILGLSTWSLSQCVHYSSGFPALALVPAEVAAPGSCDSLYLPVCLCNFGGSGLPCDFPCLMNLRRVMDFSICSVFYLFLG